MGDQYEGRIPDSIANPWRKKLDNDGFYSLSSTVKNLQNFDHVLNYNISSWNIGVSESFALWNIYTEDKKAVAIKSNIQRLIESLKLNSFSQYIGLVNYYPDSSSFKLQSNVMNLAFNKQACYQYENELRLLNIVPNNMNDKNFSHKKGDDIHVGIDLDTLIESIHLAPNSTKKDYFEVADLIEKKGLKKNIYTSKIDDNLSNK